MQIIDRSSIRVPDWRLNRVVSAQDATFDEKKLGVVCTDFEFVRFSVVPYDADPTISELAAPGGTANPNLEVFIWSEGAGLFLSFDTAITKTGVGAGDAYIVDVSNAYGAILLPAVTNDPSGQIVAIYSQGWDYN